jgi:RING finger protein 113A
MHDRTDYKHGWEIERDWAEGKLKEAKDDEYLVSSGGEGDLDDEKLPHSCFICREHFTQPVVTK